MDSLKSLGSVEEIRAVCQRATQTPTSLDEPQPWTQTERINVGDMGHTFAALRAVRGMEKCLKVAKEMAEGTSPTPFAFFYGGVGNGKSHLLEAAVIRLNERGLWTRYNTWGEIIGNLRRYLHNADPMMPLFDVVLSRWCRAPRLVIDDLGMGTTDTEWEMAQLEAILTTRYRLTLWTMIATNKDIRQLPPRVVSRLLDQEICTACVNEAADYRKSKRARLVPLSLRG